MIVLKFLSTTLVLVLLFLFSSSDSQEKPIRSGPADSEIGELVRRVNARRQSIGCPELEWDERIAAVAQRHSGEMVSRNFFSHSNPDGEDPFDRLKKAHIGFSAVAENIALGPATGKGVYESWMNNSSHRRNMLNCRYLRHGVGRVGERWTHVLVKP